MKLALLAGVILMFAVVSAVVLNRPPEPQTIHRKVAPRSEKAIERGRVVYERAGCPTCHGPDAKSGISNPNSEAKGEKIPAAVYVEEAYTKPELRGYLMKGNPVVGKERKDGPPPPYRMPGGLGLNRADASDLTEYLWSLYPEEERGKSQKW